MRKSAKLLAAVVVAASAVATGCGGDGTQPVDPMALEGAWTYELTTAYLTGEGVAEQDARRVAGSHRFIIRGGQFRDKWLDEDGKTVQCGGWYVIDGSVVTFFTKWNCVGDWSMTPSIDGVELGWTDVETLRPAGDPGAQAFNEAVLGVPWTRGAG